MHKTFIVVFLILSIGLVMANESRSAPSAMDRFEKRINYPNIVENTPDDTKVRIDWSEFFNELKLPDGTIWRSYTNTIGMGLKKSGSISDYFENDDKKTHVRIKVYSGITNRQVIEEAMIMTSYTSMMNITAEYLADGPGDFYLYYPSIELSEEIVHNKVRCVFRNVIVEVDTVQDDVDVRPIVEYLVAKMNSALVITKEIPDIQHSLTMSPQAPKVGEVFSIDINFPEPAQLQDYEIELEEDNLPDGLNYADFKGGQYYLTAARSGLFTFELLIMDKRTLLIETVNVTVDISPQ